MLARDTTWQTLINQSIQRAHLPLKTNPRDHQDNGVNMTNENKPTNNQANQITSSFFPSSSFAYNFQQQQQFSPFLMQWYAARQRAMIFANEAYKNSQHVAYSDILPKTSVSSIDQSDQRDMHKIGLHPQYLHHTREHQEHNNNEEQADSDSQEHLNQEAKAKNESDEEDERIDSEENDGFMTYEKDALEQTDVVMDERKCSSLSGSPGKIKFDFTKLAESAVADDSCNEELYKLEANANGSLADGSSDNGSTTYGSTANGSTTNGSTTKCPSVNGSTAKYSSSNDSKLPCSTLKVSSGDDLRCFRSADHPESQSHQFSSKLVQIQPNQPLSNQPQPNQPDRKSVV